MANKTTRKKPLTRKQQLFVSHILNNPKANDTDAAVAAYNPKDRNSAQSIATELMHKPNIISALAEHNNLVENTIISTIDEWGDENNTRKREIATNLATWVHDKVHGKATQRVQTESKVVTIAINLTGDGEQPPIDL